MTTFESKDLDAQNRIFIGKSFKVTVRLAHANRTLDTSLRRLLDLEGLTQRNPLTLLH